MGPEQEVTDPNAVEAALDEFEAIGRDAFLEKYGFGRAQKFVIERNGASYDAKAVLGAARGYQFPDRGPLRAVEIESNDASVRRPLERLGFTVATIGGSFRKVLEDTLAELSRRELGQGFDPAHLEALITRMGPQELQGAAPQGWSVKGRTGVGTSADVPWIGLFSPEAESTAKEGFYLVYLFAKDGSAVYLSLNQGTERLARPEAALRKRVLDIRSTVASQPDLEVEPDLKSDNLRPKKYGWGSAFAYRYEHTSIPEDQILRSDLERMTELLESALASGLSFNPEIEPVHLLFEWNSDDEARTIELHREVAERQGSVWWGRFAGLGAPKVSSRRIARLATQIAAGIPTYAFLHGSGETWRAEIIAVQDGEPEASDARFPSYYKPKDCDFFVLLKNFEPLTPNWPTEHLVIAMKYPLTLAGALSDQATPRFVFERFQAASQPARSGENVWLEIMDKCRDHMEHGTPILTLDRNVPNHVVGVQDSAIVRRSDEERGGNANATRATIKQIWEDLLEGEEIHASVPLWVGPTALNVCFPLVS